MRITHLAAAAALALGAGLAALPAAGAQDMIVEKKTFELPSFTTVSGRTVKGVKVGWEAYGKLNEAKDNVVLITHFFSGTSHAAGKYTPGDKAPGYWDAIIGPGKAIDTNKYYVVASDTLANLSPKDPTVVTTGPASINPDTGKPYGLDFPLVTIKDFVNVQKALLESLGITRLKAVVGASMGALQAYEWAASYPDMVERIIPVIGAPTADAYLIGWLSLWAQPILDDPNWNKGDYYGKEPPVAGLKTALKLVTLHANAAEWADRTFGRALADEAKNPFVAVENKFKIETALDQAATARANVADANHFLYLVKASQSAAVDPAKITVPTMLLYSPTDQVFLADSVRAQFALIKNARLKVSKTIAGPYGHLNGVLEIRRVASDITQFLDHDMTKPWVIR